MSQNTDQSHITLRVGRRAEIAVNALLLELESASGEVLPEWPPGAHLDIHLPSGLTRQYSLCGAREDRSTYVVVVLREPHGRGGSEEIYRELGVGTEFISSTPRDHFRLVDASEYVLIAGGIGITPLWAMAQRLNCPASPSSLCAITGVLLGTCTVVQPSGGRGVAQDRASHADK